MKILLAEDDQDLGEGICIAFKREHYIVDWYQDGILAEQAFKNSSYDIFILDINLPRQDGFSIIDKNTAQVRKTPILILTALSDTSSCVKGLNKGADDYLVKPFEFDELKARILSIIRRHQNISSLILEHRDLKINIDDNLIHFKNKTLTIPYKEFTLLKVLMLNKTRTLTKEQIIEKMYCDDEYRESNVLEAHVYNLRKVLGKDYIKTIRNIGYRMG